MNVSSEKSVSLWMDTPVLDAAPPLRANEHADVVVVGSGIAGMSVAYELASRGKDVVVVDRGPIGKGMTSRTTAHLSADCDDGFHEMIARRGAPLASAWYESQAASIDRIETHQRELAIACDFRRVDGHLFLAPETDSEVLDREYEAARTVGMPVFREQGVPFSGRASTPALRYPNQARFHPLKYLAGLAAAIRKAGGRFYAETIVQGVDEDENGVRVTTSDSVTVHAKHAVVATNSPINDRFAIHTKQAPYRTYAMAFAVPAGGLADGLYWDTLDPYNYVRLQPGDDGEEILIVGGADHKTGEADDAPARFADLEAWMRKMWPDLGRELNRWSGQVQETIDFSAFIGRNPGSARTYVATGDSGQGMTHGAVAGLLISDLIFNGNASWTEVYDPSRKPIKAAGRFVSENLTLAKNFAEYVAPGELRSWETLRPGHGAIVRRGLKKIAAYRDPQGRLHLHSAACSHLGCHLHWNSFESCWDCPCHGSQFAPDGTALNGPAVGGLKPFEE
jgi:glycine/D-amino acid oxidase-like deaminating enzyme/nitrite reductase/ring-hydroxylating ferredoxin subunit